MNKAITICCIAAGTLFIANSCSNKSAHRPPGESAKDNVAYAEEKEATVDRKSTGYASKDSTAPPSLSSAAAVEQSKDGMRFVRTADVKFQVSNVTDATYRIEDVTTQYGGFVTYTNLHSTVSSNELVPVSADSSLSITYYTVENDITLRVPNKRLDSALRAMSGLVDFLDQRLIVATEVSGQSLANDLAEKRSREYEQRMQKHADKSNAKDDNAISAEDKALQGREASDNAKLASLSLENQIKYSTVHLQIYQKQTSRKVKVCNDSNIERYKPSFVIQIWEALQRGLELFEDLVIVIAHLWAFILVVVLFVIGYRRIRRRKPDFK